MTEEKTLLEEHDMEFEFENLAHVLDSAFSISRDLEDTHAPDFYMSQMFDELSCLICLCQSKARTIEVMSRHRLAPQKTEMEPSED